MNYSDSVGEAAESMRLVLPLMSKYEIPIDPMNYAVWYEYVSGKNQALTSTINQIIKKIDKLPLDINRELFNRFIAMHSESDLDEVHKGLLKILTEILKNIIDAGDEATQFSELLSQSSSQLKAVEASAAVQGIVDLILTETKKMEDSGKLLQDRLLERNKEIEELRSEMKVIREQASVDMLTKIANRRVFDETLTNQCKKADASHEALSLAIIDVDHFKTINDTYGHLVGDSVIKTVANILKENIKGKDLVARYGGDEFVIILPNTNVEGAMSLTNYLCATVDKKRFTLKNKGERIGKVTLSIGVTCYKTGETIEEFLNRADAALYLSKEAGRNQVNSA